MTSRGGVSDMSTILLVIVVLLLVGALPTWPYSSGWGYYPSGGLGLILLILIILAVSGRLCAPAWSLPRPVADVGKVFAVARDVLRVLEEPVAQQLLHVGHPRAEPRHALDDVAGEVEAVEVVQDHHVERRGGRAFLLVTAHVEVVVIGPPVGQPVDQPRVAVEGEDHRAIAGEEVVEVP